MMKSLLVVLALCATLSHQQALNTTTNDTANVTVPTTNSNTTNTTSPAANVTAPVNSTLATNLTLNATNTTLNATNATNELTPKGNCEHFCRRREIRNVSPQERSRYFAAVKKLMGASAGGAPSKYDALVKLHIDATEHAHNNQRFLPWHRAYLSEFERELQAIDRPLCVSYWNWSVDSQAPEMSAIFTEEFFGDSSSGCVRNGVFAGWKPYYPQPHCLERRYKYGDALGAFHPYEGVNRVLTQSNNYLTLCRKIETVLHPAPHTNIGGDMSEMHSPNDPVFWTHHAFIDYMWAQWQRKHSYSDYSGVKAERLLGLTKTVNDVLDHRMLCYEYADFEDVVSSVPAPTVKHKEEEYTKVVPLPNEQNYSSTDRSNLNVLRYADDADEAWLKRNGYDVQEVRGYESEYRTVYKQLNEIKGYVSPCSLWKRPTLCAELIRRQKPLYADVAGYGRVQVKYDAQVDVYQAYSNIKQRVVYCTPDVEYPEDQYRKAVEKLVGSAAFKGAGTLAKVGSEDDLPSSAVQVHNMALTVAVAMAAFMTQ